MKEKLLTFFKKETILCIACLLAVLSACIVPPDTAYLGYVDTRVLILLFSLMAVLAGFRALGIFDRMANLLLVRAKKMRQLALTLVMLCFFSAMLVTNDVALITFVPFTILLLQRVHLEEKLIPVIVLQTIAANLGSMLTPVGNPQNLYLYTISGIGVGAFFRITLPFVLVSFFLLLLLCFLQGNTPLATQPQAAPPTRTGAEKQQLFGLTVLFFLCLLAVFRILPILPLLALALVWFLLFQKGILKEVDYCLLLTFIFFFILIGNLGRISAIRQALQALMQGREVLIAFLSSQCISNVPAAVLLSEFTDRYDLLLAGVNIGGLGTLIASMASLISYKYFAQIPNVGKGRYLLWFTLANLLFAVILLGLAALLPS